MSSVCVLDSLIGFNLFLTELPCVSKANSELLTVFADAVGAAMFLISYFRCRKMIFFSVIEILLHHFIQETDFFNSSVGVQ